MFRMVTAAVAGGLTLAGTITGVAQSAPEPMPACTDEQVEITVAPEEGGGSAGAYRHLVTMTNTSDAACSITGFPGVDHRVEGQGAAVGSPAARVERPEKPQPVELAPGQKAIATLDVTEGGKIADCRPTEAVGFWVYMPNGTARRMADDPHSACTNHEATNMRIGPAQAA